MSLFATDYIPADAGMDHMAAMMALSDGHADVLMALGQLAGVDPAFHAIVVDSALDQGMTADDLAAAWQRTQESRTPAVSFGLAVLAGDITIEEWGRHPRVTLFDHLPSLRTIWRPDLTEIAARHAREWESSDEAGMIYLVMAGRLLLGVTGWYRTALDGAVGLRWHGVCEFARRHGVSRIALDMLCAELPADVRWLYEATRNPASRDSFLHSGFEAVTDPAKVAEVCKAADYDVSAGGWVVRRRVHQQ